MGKDIPQCFCRDGIRVIYQVKLILSHQAEGREAEECMKDVCLVARPVRKAAPRAILLQILTVQYVLAQTVEIDQILAVDHETGRQDPP